MKGKVLVTGGLGYIGSHTVVELQNEGFDVVIIDNLSNSRAEVLDGIESITGIRPDFEFIIDLKNKSAVKRFFSKYSNLKNVIHFAASKAVGESVEDPLLYYENNINSLIYLLQGLLRGRDINYIFSSSCTVYGNPKHVPITELEPIKKASSPYGNTKQIREEILEDVCKSNSSFNTISLRYFNPIGAHPSLAIGELPVGIPQNLVPYITQTAMGIRKELSVFGDDYLTHDGTCMRDYIHVVDLAKAHVKAMFRLLNEENESNYEIFNLGTGKGHSVMEVIKLFEKVNACDINYKIVGRRKGDVTCTFADSKKAKNLLKWDSEYSIEDALKSAYMWEQSYRESLKKCEV